MPGWLASIFVEIELIPTKEDAYAGLFIRPRESPSSEQNEREDILGDMVEMSFVDLGPSSIRLVLEDGELVCHSFPLAAR